MHETSKKMNFHQDFEIERNLSANNEFLASEEDLERGFKCLELYNHEISFEENFVGTQNSKYILVEVTKDGNIFVPEEERNNTPLSPFDRVVVNMEDYDNYGFENCMVDYDTIFGTRFLTFIKYDSDFISCDERVFFEALLIKYKKSGYKSFYWSRERIFKELGIKKDRADKIISKFKDLGIMTVKKQTRVSDGKPQQVNYFFLNPTKIVELLPKMFKDDEEFIYPLHRDIKRYLKPGVKKQ